MKWAQLQHGDGGANGDCGEEWLRIGKGNNMPSGTAGGYNLEQSISLPWRLGMNVLDHAG
jgi:hypothetical protein